MFRVTCHIWRPPSREHQGRLVAAGPAAAAGLFAAMRAATSSPQAMQRPRHRKRKSPGSCQAGPSCVWRAACKATSKLSRYAVCHADFGAVPDSDPLAILYQNLKQLKNLLHKCLPLLLSTMSLLSPTCTSAKSIHLYCFAVHHMFRIYDVATTCDHESASG